MELIDKKALRNALFNGEHNLYSWEEIEAKIDALPTTEVVKCKDCYWWYTGKTKDGTVDLSHCNRGIRGNGEDFFCCLGQRKVNR